MRHVVWDVLLRPGAAVDVTHTQTTAAGDAAPPPIADGADVASSQPGIIAHNSLPLLGAGNYVTHSPPVTSADATNSSTVVAADLTQPRPVPHTDVTHLPPGVPSDVTHLPQIASADAITDTPDHVALLHPVVPLQLTPCLPFSKLKVLPRRLVLPTDVSIREECQTLRAVLSQRLPCVISGGDIGPCRTLWTADFLQNFPEAKSNDVSVHVCKEPSGQLSFVPRNFSFEHMTLAALVEACSRSSRLAS